MYVWECYRPRLCGKSACGLVCLSHRLFVITIIAIIIILITPSWILWWNIAVPFGACVVYTKHFKIILGKWSFLFANFFVGNARRVCKDCWVRARVCGKVFRLKNGKYLKITRNDPKSLWITHFQGTNSNKQMRLAFGGTWNSACFTDFYHL